MWSFYFLQENQWSISLGSHCGEIPTRLWSTGVTEHAQCCFPTELVAWFASRCVTLSCFVSCLAAQGAATSLRLLVRAGQSQPRQQAAQFFEPDEVEDGLRVPDEYHKQTVCMELFSPFRNPLACPPGGYVWLTFQEWEWEGVQNTNAFIFGIISYKLLLRPPTPTPPQSCGSMDPSRMTIPVRFHGEVHVQPHGRFIQPIRLLQV